MVRIKLYTELSEQHTEMLDNFVFDYLVLILNYIINC